MQTSLYPLKNSGILLFGPKWHAMFWSEWKINFPIFSFWDTFDLVQNFEVFLPTKYGRKKMSQMMSNVLKRIFEFLGIFGRFLVSELSSISYFTSVMHWQLRWIQKKYLLGGSTPLNPPFLWGGFPTTPTSDFTPRPRMLLDWISNLTG